MEGGREGGRTIDIETERKREENRQDTLEWQGNRL